jgi:hypothetical protein
MRGYVVMVLKEWGDMKVTGPTLLGEFPLRPIPGTAGFLLVYEDEATAKMEWPGREIVEIEWSNTRKTEEQENLL